MGTITKWATAVGSLSLFACSALLELEQRTPASGQVQDFPADNSATDAGALESSTSTPGNDADATSTLDAGFCSALTAGEFCEDFSSGLGSGWAKQIRNGIVELAPSQGQLGSPALRSTLNADITVGATANIRYDLGRVIRKLRWSADYYFDSTTFPKTENGYSLIRLAVADTDERPMEIQIGVGGNFRFYFEGTTIDLTATAPLKKWIRLGVQFDSDTALAKVFVDGKESGSLPFGNNYPVGKNTVLYLGTPWAGKLEGSLTTYCDNARVTILP